MLNPPHSFWYYYRGKVKFNRGIAVDQYWILMVIWLELLKQSWEIFGLRKPLGISLKM